MTSPIDGIWIAHVADILEADHGANDYDLAAEYAYLLLCANPDLLAMASQYANGDAGHEWLADAVNTAVQLDTDTESRCPTCGGPLESRGGFDGTVASSGMTGGHQGFGATVICEQGHWWTWLHGALIPPEHILTVIEKGQL